MGQRIHELLARATVFAVAVAIVFDATAAERRDAPSASTK